MEVKCKHQTFNIEHVDFKHGTGAGNLKTGVGEALIEALKSKY